MVIITLQLDSILLIFVSVSLLRLVHTRHILKHQLRWRRQFAYAVATLDVYRGKQIGRTNLESQSAIFLEFYLWGGELDSQSNSASSEVSCANSNMLKVAGGSQS